MRDPREADLEIPFRIQFSKEHGISGQQGDKGNEVVACHRVLRSKVIIVFDLFNRKPGLLGGFFGLKRADLLPAAGNFRGGKRCKDIPAVWTNVKNRFFHISGNGWVEEKLALQKRGRVNLKGLCQFRNQGKIRTSKSSFP